MITLSLNDLFENAHKTALEVEKIDELLTEIILARERPLTEEEGEIYKMVRSCKFSVARVLRETP